MKLSKEEFDKQFDECFGLIIMIQTFPGNDVVCLEKSIVNFKSK